MNATKKFIDTNVLLYSLDAREPTKREIARHLVTELSRGGNGYVSTQVLKEFASNLIRKFGRPPSEVAELCADLSELRLELGSMVEVQEALRIMDEASVSFWDACIVAAAKSAGCRIILTEDLHDAQVIGGVRIVNPFAV